MTHYIRRYAVLFVTALMLQLPTVANASHCEDSIAIAVSVQGTVEEKIKDQWTPVKRGDAFCAGDLVRVRKDSRAIIRLLVEQTNITLNQHSTLSFSTKKEDTFSWVELLKGAAHFISRVPQSLKIKTPYVNAAVEGTEFLILVKENQTEISVFEGHVALSNEQGKLDLKTGDSGLTREGEAPSQSVKVNPVDAVQWALFYPPILTRPDNAPKSVFPPTLKEDHDPQLITYYAAQLLGAGRVEEAEKNIEKAISLDQGDSNAIALKSIIAVVKNQKEAALQYAQQAVELNHSAAAHIALSYAYQAQFNLPAALDAAKDATQVEPENSIAWARLADLRLSQGELNKALDAANKAAQLDPELAYSQTILGFAHLTRIKTKNAKQAFEKAITLNPAAPLPHLGLGLAMIREGDLEQGRVELETATSLDPRNSLMRSYVGKAYYEEKRNELAAEQFAMAKQLDPKDPTPWFYDAIRKQTENNPVEALNDLRESIKLNDNRAVYRSSLLLDSDEAARSASQARIYRDLGFDQLALIEGWKSINTDPENFSGHRLLADSYSELPRHEIARVSELLQSQLMQPLNVNPIQPQLAESNLGILDGSGPSDLSSNEFNPMFTRNGVRFQANIVAGSNSTLGDDIAISGIQNKFSYSLSQFHYETDGFKNNDDAEHDIYDFFAQYSITPNLSIQAEYRDKESETGDTVVRFNPEDTFPDRRFNTDVKTARVGLNYKINPKSTLLVSYVDIDHKELLTDQFFDPVFDELFIDKFSVTRNGYNAEIQNIYNGNKFKLISGIGYIDQDGKDLFTSDFFVGSIFIDTFILSDINVESKYGNAYLYAPIEISADKTIVAGISYDSLEELPLDETQINPKLGFLWDINNTTTFRTAAFRVFKRPFTFNQTIEPTQVAGFNQFFDDGNGTDSKRIGVGLDHTINKRINSGIELTRREITRQVISLGPGTSRDDEREELFHRLYVNWNILKHLTLNTQLQYEEFQRDLSIVTSSDPVSIETYTLPIQIIYNSPNAYSIRYKMSYVHQDVEIPNAFDSSIIDSGKDSFWISDLSFNYRLPKRLGLIGIEVKNIFNEEFQFQSTNFETGTPRSLLYALERSVFITANINF